MKIKKIFDEITMIGLGGGVAVAGASSVIIGLQVVKKNPYGAGIAMVFGAMFAQVGSQVALGAIERIRGQV